MVQLTAMEYLEVSVKSQTRPDSYSLKLETVILTPVMSESLSLLQACSLAFMHLHMHTVKSAQNQKSKITCNKHAQTSHDFSSDLEVFNQTMNGELGIRSP